jgi:hypothetical protein
MINSPRFAAVISTILFVSVLGVLIAVGSFGLLRIGEEIGEGLGLVPARWGENNLDLLVLWSGVLAIPVVLWSTVWFFRRALKTEKALENYTYTIPETPKQAKK